MREPRNRHEGRAEFDQSMASSDSETPEAPEPEESSHEEASRAAAGLKDQIAALRDRVRSAKAHLSAGRRAKEPRSFSD